MSAFYDSLSAKEKRAFDHQKNILDSRAASEKVVFIIIFIIFALYAISLVFPFVYLFINSLQEKNIYIDNLSEGGNAFALPTELHFENYVTALSGMAMTNSNGDPIYLPEMFFNSIWYTFAIVGGGVFASTLTGYCLAKYAFRGRQLLYGIAIFTMTIPIVGSTGSSFKLMSDLNIYNTPWYPFLTGFGGFGFNFLVMYGFFKNISWSYAEAVFIDGGGHFTVFNKIMLPQAKPLLITLGIMAFIGAWNDYMTSLLYMPDFPTIAAGIYRIQFSFTREGNMPAYFAGLIMSVVPVVVLFACFSDVIMNNLTMGGLKG